MRLIRLKVWINIFCPRHMWEPQLILFTRYSVCNSNLFAEMQRHTVAGCQGAKTLCTPICTHAHPHNTHTHTHTHTHTQPPSVITTLTCSMQALCVIKLTLEAKAEQLVTQRTKTILECLSQFSPTLFILHYFKQCGCN